MPAEYPRWKTGLKKIPGLVSLVRLCRIVGNPGYRSEWRLEHEKPDNLFQPVGLTSFDRYPRIFSIVKEHLSEIDSPRLLSFGCSTGEEVFTLRQYFPNAEIAGLDINPRSIALCRKQLERSGDSRIRFELAGSPKAEPGAYYDAVFCMAVLRHGKLGVNRPENCSSLIRFEDFENTVTGLCRILKPGGYLVIRHSNFRFSDTAISSEFAISFCMEDLACRTETPIYDRDNRLLANFAYDEVIFLKRKNPRILP